MDLFDPVSNPLGLPTNPAQPTIPSATHSISGGTCIPPAETEASLAPCIRVNGKLVPNPDVTHCRYFKTQLPSPSDTTCPTICPDMCVELWDTCPSGSGQLTTAVHSKDVLATIRQMLGTFTTNKTHKDYRECYSFGTKFCTYPDTKLTRLEDGTYACHKDCPPNTYSDGDMCYASDPDGSPSGANLHCNPQYFTSVITNGSFVGCQKIPLGAKDTNSCPANHETIVNESFTVEWCLPKCPTGFVASPNLDFCFATCDTGTPFQNYASYFIQDGRCTTANCPAQMNGRCPVPTALAATSNTYGGYRANSAPERMQEYSFADDSLAETLRNGTQVSKPGTGTVQCPVGMVAALPNTGEVEGFCYDRCPVGFAPAELCENTSIITTSGTPACDTKYVRHICLANCPTGWTEKIVDAKHTKLATCAYNYPNQKVPTDPSLFVNCPSDGTMISVSNPDTTLPSGRNATPVPPVCVRKHFQRHLACPLEHTQLGTTCVKNCPANSLPIYKDGTITCTQTCSMDSRYSHDAASLYSTSIDPDFQDASCIRKSVGTGAGEDPLTLQSPTPVSDARSIGFSMSALLLIPVGLILLRKIL